MLNPATPCDFSCHPAQRAAEKSNRQCRTLVGIIWKTKGFFLTGRSFLFMESGLPGVPPCAGSATGGHKKPNQVHCRTLVGIIRKTKLSGYIKRKAHPHGQVFLFMEVFPHVLDPPLAVLQCWTLSLKTTWKKDLTGSPSRHRLRLFFVESGNHLPGRLQVPSALKGLTSVFGMGTGGSLSPLSPENCEGLVQSFVFLVSAPSLHNRSFHLGDFPHISRFIFYCAYPENRTSRLLTSRITSFPIFPLVSTQFF